MGSESQANKNVGSSARDHLANERTLLAWVRTALGVVGLGAVVGRLFETTGRFPGLLLIGFGALMLGYGAARYVRVMKCLQHGQFPVANRGPVVVAGLALAVTVAAGLLVSL